jgi:hypothetical protein
MMGSGVQITQAAPFVKIQNNSQTPPICPRLDFQFVVKKNRQDREPTNSKNEDFECRRRFNERLLDFTMIDRCD